MNNPNKYPRDLRTPSTFIPVYMAIAAITAGGIYMAVKPSPASEERQRARAEAWAKRHEHATTPYTNFNNRAGESGSGSAGEAATRRAKDAWHTDGNGDWEGIEFKLNTKGKGAFDVEEAGDVRGVPVPNTRSSAKQG
ncbi:hypothetical protein D9611_010701 [Ephemerocybe angulata]|uniref:Uncharacterized protein n=1 Tax=Ephemerocybe angulata TaxID=980116 RepID=A0A8H5F1W2_9AGAR|nr:hypothetical protein D9611_010701 [Tulosesus angulatus]